MTDVVSSAVRSRMMSGIRSKNTEPEILIRTGLFKLGFRYILHDKRLPGRPDIVFPRYRAVIIINGCFWHGHECHLFKWPKSRVEFWQEKIHGNKKNDQKCNKKLRLGGWRVLTIWECAIKGLRKWPVDDLFDCVSNWLFSDKNHQKIAGLSLSQRCKLKQT